MKSVFILFFLLQCCLFLACEDPASSGSDKLKLSGSGVVTESGDVLGYPNSYHFEGSDAFSFGFKHTDQVSFKAEYYSYNKRKNEQGGSSYTCTLISMTRN